ncbi:MAG: YebC/PmpR family DNA-binding transcriptional regulator, partial [Planctomycetota bacterium]|nr:YebC/PmpR family DNA-binding transcriptional regulator [Planctomycetota bacterium]
PKDNIDRAIKKGTGELDGGDMEEILYEGYGPGGVAVMCDIMTDNRNRTAPEIRKLFEVHGGKLGATGCVSYLFERKGLITVPETVCDEEQLFEWALDAGADDVRHARGQYEIYCPPESYSDVLEAIEQRGIEPDLKQISRIPASTVELDATTGRKLLKFLELLDDHDDVQSVSANFSISDEAMTAILQNS